MRARRLLAPLIVLPLGGCSVAALDPRGEGAADVAALFWLFTIVAAFVWALVVAALLVAAFRRRNASVADPLANEPRGERRATRIVGSCVVLTGIVIAALTLFSYLTGRSLAHLGGPDALAIRITGHQWWWEVRYDDPVASKVLTTANEIHIPVGRPVRIELASDDVIHSFWVPSLSGKQDLIPGIVNAITIKADRPGVYRGPCAEFCGLQHAHMTAFVVAESEDDFAAWREAQLAPAAPPAEPERQRGEAVFTTRGCFMCHAIRGTSAAGRVAPDLTHVGGRRYLAAGALPMSRGSLAAWIRNPQGIKPGANMPEVDLTPDELNALVAYLVELK